MNSPVVERGLKAILDAIGKQQTAAEPHADAAVCDARKPMPDPARCERIPGADLDEKTQCLACKGWLWWHSVHGQILCATCHPPAAPHLVQSWWWGNMPETKQ